MTTPAHLAPTPENLRALREAAGKTQKEIAEMIHLSGFSRISDWERGQHPIDPARWELLLVKLGKHGEYKKRSRKDGTSGSGAEA